MTKDRKSLQTRSADDGDRALTARSVLASALLGTDPPELPVSQLVALAGLFGVTGNGARVALSRMVAAGELAARDSRYRLRGHLLARHRRQRQSRNPAPTQWKGGWTMFVVTRAGRDARSRDAARRALRAARLAERREGLWIRPDNVAVDLPPDVAAQGDRFRARPIGDPAALAAELWDLSGWATRADRLLTRLADTAPAVQRHDRSVLAPGFVLSASVLRHLQADPLLPPALEPLGWPGPALRAAYDEWDRSALTMFHKSVASG
jgi:phenylacetic acid degradation operon negative regulatory protein